MDRENFDWALVKSFLAVLDAGSMMGAARRLGAQQHRCSSAPGAAWRPRRWPCPWPMRRGAWPKAPMPLRWGPPAGAA
jgi:hypothetical protein